MIQEGTGAVTSESQGAIGFITFSHPAHNSLPSKLLRLLAERILELGRNPLLKVIVLKSGGDRTFCAGANFREMAAIQDLEESTQFFKGFANVINAIRTCGKIVIGRLQGKAVGGGVGLAAAVDYCMATKWSSIRLSEISLGIGPFVIEPALRRKIGVSGFSQLALNPTEWQTAKWAKQQGLFQEMFDTTDLLDNYMARYLDKLQSYDLNALGAMKAVLWEGTEHWEHTLVKRSKQSGSLLLSAYCQERLSKLLQKEKFT
ncbi:MAG: enoyl-CoA hydratase/isomerase family protein [Saprospiraceae bacterium]|nr:enoyl-CoA hydratase/isomerase family protein [Saprospiraceae bacterium]